jgi:hypothetical protein
LAQGRAAAAATILPCNFAECEFLATTAANLALHIVNDASPAHMLPTVEKLVLLPDFSGNEAEMRQMLADHSRYWTHRATELISALHVTASNDANSVKTLKAILTVLMTQVRVCVLVLQGCCSVVELLTINRTTSVTACSK